MRIIKSIGIGSAIVGCIFMVYLTIELYLGLSITAQYILGILALIAVFSACAYCTMGGGDYDDDDDIEEYN